MLPAALLLALFALPPKPPPPKDQPVLRTPVPFALPAGKSKFVIRGLKLDTATEVKADGGVGVKLLSKKKLSPPNNYPAERFGDSEVEIEVELPKDFAAESVAFTAVTPAGTSAPLAVFTSEGAAGEKEPNDGFATAQPLPLPATLDGTFGKEKDADVFKLSGKKGQTVTVTVFAASRGSLADVLLGVYDADRQSVRTADVSGGKGDPAVRFAFPADGVVYVSVLEGNDGGGAGFAYRLKVE